MYRVRGFPTTGKESIEQWVHRATGPLCGSKLIHQGLKIYAHSGVDMAREATSLFRYFNSDPWRSVCLEVPLVGVV